jgi:hypothetical protein
MNDSVKNRLIAFIKSQGISVNRFEKICGFSTGYVGNMRKSIQPDKVMSIIQNFPTLNTAWLFTGEGEMQKKLNNEITTVLQDNSNTHNPTQNNEHIIELLKKDVKYYADMADSRLETIKVQTKLIEKLEEQLKTQ